MKNNENNVQEINKDIKIAGIGKRILTAIIDGFVIIFLWLVLQLFVCTPIANSTMNYENNILQIYEYRAYSHLYVYVQVEDDVDHIIQVKDYSEKINADLEGRYVSVQSLDFDNCEDYLGYVQYYYLNYLAGVNVDVPNDIEGKTYDEVDFMSPLHNKEIILEDGSSVLPKDYYTVEWYNINILEIGEDYSMFEYVTDSYGNILTNEIGVLKENSNIDDSIIFAKQAIYDANSNLFYSPFYSQINEALKGAQLFIYLTPFFPIMAIFYILVPMLYKNGETLGKKVLSLCLVNKKGYQVSKAQIFLRQFTFVLEISLFLFIIGVGMTSFATLGVGLFILLMIALVSKNTRTIHDFAAATIVIDAKKSLWHKNANKEQQFSDKLDENLAKYKKEPTIGKNVIQVGDQIIEENLNDLDNKN